MPIMVYVRMSSASVLSSVVKTVSPRREVRQLPGLLLAMERLNAYDEDEVRGGL